MDKIYNEILHIPGNIAEFGVHYGRNIALFEALRGVYEPYNFNRKILGFDTFSGFTSISDKDPNAEKGKTISASQISTIFRGDTEMPSLDESSPGKRAYKNLRG